MMVESVLAEKKYEEGTKHYILKHYDKALSLFKEATKLDSSVPRYWNNSSRCHFILGKYVLASQDAKKSINLDSKFINGYIQLAKCLKVLDDLSYAKVILEKGLKHNPEDGRIESEINSLNKLIELEENIQSILKLGQVEEALKNIGEYLSSFPTSKKYLLLKANCLIKLHKYSDANEIVEKVLKNNSEDEDALYCNAMCKFYSGYIVDTFGSLKEIKMSNLDHEKISDMYKKARKTMQLLTDIDALLERNNLNDAYVIYKEAIETIDEDNYITKKVLLLKRIEIGSNCPDLTKQIIIDCTEYKKEYSQEMDAKDLEKVLKIRAKCNVGIQEYEDAIDDYEELLKLSDNVEYRLLYEKTKKNFNEKCNNNYKILKIEEGSNSSKKSIKKAYEALKASYQNDCSKNSENKKKRIELAYKQIIDKLYPIADESTEQSGCAVPQVKVYTAQEVLDLLSEQEFEKANMIVTRMLNRNPNNEEFIYLQALCKFYSDNIEKSIDTISKNQKLIPNYSKMANLYSAAQETLKLTKEISETMDKIKKYELLDKATKIDPNNLTTIKDMLLQKIEIAANIPDLQKKCLTDYTTYINLFGAELEILKSRGIFNMKIIEYEDAINDFKEVLKMENSIENKKLYDEAVELFTNENNSPARILRLDENETNPDVIKREFYKLLLHYHPDKHPNITKERQKQLENKIIRAKKAYASIQKNLNIKIK